jgi:hypothetical protein
VFVISFAKKIHVQQKVTFFMGDSPSFFSEKGRLKNPATPSFF